MRRPGNIGFRAFFFVSGLPAYTRTSYDAFENSPASLKRRDGDWDYRMAFEDLASFTLWCPVTTA
jgi:hypothetical protein